MVDLYISRRLKIGEEYFSDAQALAQGKILVVLAEPGAGKTVLMREFARQLDVKPVRASVFIHQGQPAELRPLVIDAIDEAAKFDQFAIDRILAKAQECSNGQVVFASRSDGWDQGRTKLVQECFGVEPKIIRIEPLTSDEQKLLFEAYLSGEDFRAFSGEASRFELTPLLGNPQFLQLFADAYVQGGRKFVSKSQIFRDAVERLAVEAGGQARTGSRPPTSRIVEVTAEVMAKILLSGGSGVSGIERLGDDDYPYLNSMISSPDQAASYVLGTRLFKPAITEDQHEPVHRIVAEYCAAQYIVARVGNAARPVSLKRCLAVIAPNGVIRDELRGMLGWMAAVGPADVQRAAVEIDAYAVLANGDPSQLATSVKKVLLQQLRAIAENNPGFQRSDVWRRFSVAGFFEAGIVEDVLDLLRTLPPQSPLLDLLLQLLHDSGAPAALEHEIRSIMLNPGSEQYTRVWASRALAGMARDGLSADFAALVAESSGASLRVAADMLAEAGVDRLEDEEICGMLVGFAGLYPSNRETRFNRSTNTYFMKEAIELLSSEQAGRYLDRLTDGVSCTCGKEEYECYCRNGVSKTAGRLLDRYFETAGPADFDPARIWSWVKALRFENHKGADNSAAVRILSEDHALRHQVHRLAFAGLSTREEIRKVLWHFRNSHGHSGLSLQVADYWSMADFAFETDNTSLWSSIWQSPIYRADARGPDPFRAHLRLQSREKPPFKACWARLERGARQFRKEESARWERGHWRRQKKHEKRDLARRAYLADNLEKIEAGKHFGFLTRFAHYYLTEPANLSKVVDDPEIALRALRNCLSVLKENVPALDRLALEDGWEVVRVLHAACVVHFREQGSLAAMDKSVLVAVKTDSSGFPGLTKEESSAFEAELDRLLYTSPSDIEDFARTYIEPGLAGGYGAHTHVGWLNHKSAFQHLREHLPLEWLERFPAMPLSSRNDLFNMAAVAGDRSRLLALISRRSRDALAAAPSDDEEIRRQQNATLAFWQLRRFFFEGPDSDAWDALRGDPDTIFAIDDHAGRFSDSGTEGWPLLCAEKIYQILDAYVEVWPHVHLPSSYGTGDPPDERAYRFLSDLVWKLGRGEPEKSLSVLDRLQRDHRFEHFSSVFRTVRAESVRKQALIDFSAPKPSAIASLFDLEGLASVEDLRAFVLEELANLQQWVRTSETDPVWTFYSGDKRVDENTGRNRVVDRLSARMIALNMPITIEHQLADSNRCDITVAAMVEGRRRLLVIEVKGQWHPKLNSAATDQLDELYASHQDAERQGIYLVLWFGPGEKVAGLLRHEIKTPSDLRDKIIGEMPPELLGRFDVFVLDVSIPGGALSTGVLVPVSTEVETGAVVVASK